MLVFLIALHSTCEYGNEADTLREKAHSDAMNEAARLQQEG